MSTIIFGSNGYIGRHLSNFLASEIDGILNVDIHPGPLFGQQTYQSLDIRDRHAYDSLPTNAETIYFLAGLTGTESSFQNYSSFTNSNILGLMHLLDWMRETSCTARLIFPSTRLVYKGQKDVFLREDSPKQAKTIYAMTKLASEQSIEAFANAFDISYTILRICVPYGHWVGDQYSYGTIGFMISQAIKNQQITLFGEGDQKRTFTHVRDICQIMKNVASSIEAHQQILNIGGEHFQLSDVAVLIAEKYNASVKFSPWPTLALHLESGDTLFDDSKLKAIGLGHYAHTIREYLLQ